MRKETNSEQSRDIDPVAAAILRFYTECTLNECLIKYHEHVNPNTDATIVFTADGQVLDVETVKTKTNFEIEDLGCTQLKIYNLEPNSEPVFVRINTADFWFDTGSHGIIIKREFTATSAASLPKMLKNKPVSILINAPFVANCRITSAMYAPGICPELRVSYKIMPPHRNNPA